MTRKVGRFEKEQAYREAFLARLNQKLAAPSSKWPTVRYWTKPALDKLFRQIREELAAEQVKSDLSHASLLDWICQLRLATLLPVDNESVFLFEIGASSESEMDPLELLMAAKPSGVICYFSAVAFHELTTQLVEHHHVAELQLPTPASDKKRLPLEISEPSESLMNSESRAPRGLGKLLFQAQGTSFYSTRRSSRLVPGVQTRAYGPRAQIRITTLEQTLLDTLYKPFHCGGPEVVFEAWREAVASRRIDEERLVDYLRIMSYPATARRLAVMLELAGGAPGAEFRRFLDASQLAIDRQSPHACISLLPGVDYQNLNVLWLVNTP
ncbi:hypothetical protein KIH39_19985 [Telmatocola sphagniphila]|uniref:Uncharacterized protein n=1 Tax=Telmatocola sphagniphila TaxID=1123043 RepID=A0A8E6B374_9BACT|nr:hypothetical protein [Telmatocola sphagniphila]QVL31108.1 hypothetical protein KIH39_19985 [Telmatocola sphagniphila]